MTVEGTATVTQVLRDTTPAAKREALERWRQRIGEAEADRIREEALQRGRMMDEQAALFLDTGACEHPGIAEYLSSVNVEHYECRVLSPAWRVRGRFDWMSSLGSGVLLTDMKGSNKVKHPQHLEDYRLQLGAYYGCIADSGLVDGEPFDFRRILGARILIFVDWMYLPQMVDLSLDELQEEADRFAIRASEYWRAGGGPSPFGRA